MYMQNNAEFSGIQELTFDELEEVAGGPAWVLACAANPWCVAAVGGIGATLGSALVLIAAHN